MTVQYWAEINPISLENISKLFLGCQSEKEVQNKFIEIGQAFHPDYLKGDEDYTKDDCLIILSTLNELLQLHKKGKINLVNKKKEYLDIQGKKVNFINYATYRKSFTLAKWSDFWDFDLPYGKNLLNLFNNFVVLPDTHIQLPIICAFICQNTVLMHLSNTLFLYSRKAGSGKSTIAEIVSALHNASLDVNEDESNGMSQGADTFASIRNFIAFNRVVRSKKGEIVLDYETRKPLEKNLFLVLDDIAESKLKDEDYYNLLKAYKRQNAYIRKAEKRRNEEGEFVETTIDFHVFCCKVLTACYQIFGNPEYQELTRRCLFIKCQPLEDIKEYSKEDEKYIENNLYYKGEELYKPSEIDWKGVLDQYYIAWDFEAIERYQSAFRRLRKPKEVSVSQWEITKSLAASGYALQVWDSIPESLDAVKKYWYWFKQQGIDAKSAIELVLESAIASWYECCDDPVDSSEYFPNGERNPYYPMNKDFIDPAWIDAWLKKAEKKSELNKKPSYKIRDEAMEYLGYKLRRWKNKNYYCSID